MGTLIVKPDGTTGRIHHVTPHTAGWSHVGFSCHRLAEGDTVSQTLADAETILVLVEGKARILAGESDLGELGERMDVFERTPPASAYVPPATGWQATATTACTLAVCTAPAAGQRVAAVLERPDIVERGTGTNTRYIHNIAMEDADVAESLLVTEVFTPAGHWSSYPPHRHDEDDFPRITYLEETYYHRLSPANAFAVQRVFTQDGSLDETMAVSDHDVVLVPKGHHPCGAPYGVDLYYLNVMAGPRRNWRFETHPDFAWLTERDG